jgi:SsrA-binding protein
MPRAKGTQVVARNKKAFHDYIIGDKVEAGIVLTGTEVKSLRLGRASLIDAFATIDDGEVWLRGANIPEYLQGTYHNHVAKRTRKLLLNRREIAKLDRLVSQAGRTLVPLSLYFKDGYAKVELAVGTGKHEWDKRQAIAARDADREMRRALAARNKRG